MDLPKVAFFLLRTPEESRQITGGTWSNLALLSGLDRHQVLVIVNEEDILAEELDRRGIRRVVLPAELSWRGARASVPAFARKVAGAIAFNARVRAVCEAEGVRVLQCDENAASFVGLGAKAAGARLVVAYRNYPNVVPKMKPFYKAPMLLADRLVATSELLREAIVGQGWNDPAARTSRIYNGIDTAKASAALAAADRGETRARLGIGAGEVAIGVIGSIVPFKLQAELLEKVVAPHAGELRAAKARLWFLGGVKDEAYAKAVRAIVDERGLADLTAWPGYIDDMPPWFTALDVIAFPAREGTARTLLEADAFGVPAVARDTSFEAVIDGENGFLCAEIEDLAAPLLRLAGDAGLRARMGAAGRRIAAERFDVSANRAAYGRIYDDLAAAKPSRAEVARALLVDVPRSALREIGASAARRLSGREASDPATRLATAGGAADPATRLATAGGAADPATRLATPERSGQSRAMPSSSGPAATCPICDAGCTPAGNAHFDRRTETEFTLWQCGACGLRHWSPLAHPTGAYYEDEAQAMYVAIHEGRRDGLADPRFRKFLDDFGAVRERRLLDIGCSDGALIELFARQGNRVEGIDIDRAAIDVARSRGLDARIETLDERAARDPSADLDFVTMFDVLEHVTTPLAFLRRARSLLKDGGHLIGTVPNRDRLFVDMHVSDFPPHHFLRFDAASVRRTLEIAGFRVDRVDVFQYGYAGPALLASAIRTLRGRRGEATSSAKPASPNGGSVSKSAARPSFKRRVTTAVNGALGKASGAIEEGLGRGFKLYFVATRAG